MQHLLAPTPVSELVSEWVSDSFRSEIAIASPSFASLFLVNPSLRITKDCKEFHMKSVTPNLSSCPHAGKYKSWILSYECSTDCTASKRSFDSKVSAVYWCFHSSSRWYEQLSAKENSVKSLGYSCSERNSCQLGSQWSINRKESKLPPFNLPLTSQDPTPTSHDPKDLLWPSSDLPCTPLTIDLFIFGPLFFLFSLKTTISRKEKELPEMCWWQNNRIFKKFSDAGPRGCYLVVGTRRAPRLLVVTIILK